MIKAVLFDLDGTLLPMDQDRFTDAYFKALAAWMEPHGYESEKLIRSVWTGTKAMIANDGTRTNREAFWDTFARIYGEESRASESVFDEFYSRGFDRLKDICGRREQVGQMVKTLRDRGYRLILASNPLFPIGAQKSRLVWAGVDPDDFEYISSYENSGFCKPNPAYYTELAGKNGLAPEECLMVGNDAEEDMAAGKIGMGLFLATDCLINRRNEDISRFDSGSLDQAMNYI